MYGVGDISAEAKKLIQIAEECMYSGIEAVKPYEDISVVGKAIEKHAKENGFSVVRDYGGHGVGVDFHEEPHVHHYTTKLRAIPIIPNMIFTIEPMINQGRYSTRLLVDNWTAVTADKKLSAQWAHTIIVTRTGVEILT